MLSFHALGVLVYWQCLGDLDYFTLVVLLSVSGVMTAVGELRIQQYKCDLCGKSFNHKGHLRRHEMIHTGEKPFKCEFCDKCFNQKGSLQKHVVTHISKSAYSCTDEQFLYDTT